jgi:hypothetical protein
MEKKELKSILQDAVEQEFPASQIDLLPEVKKRILAGRLRQGKKTSTGYVKSKRISRVALAALAIVALLATAFATPQGRAFAQEILQFFVRADRDRYPLQSWQMTPQVPSSVEWMSPSQLSVEEAESRAGYDVIRLEDVPPGMRLIGILFDEKYQTVAQGFGYEDQYIELSLWQQPLAYDQSCGDISSYCDNMLGSNYVGASAYVEPVRIGELTGEYLEGTWNLTDQGPVWISTPFIKFLRWQTDEMTFELVAGIEFSKEDLILLATDFR